MPTDNQTQTLGQFETREQYFLRFSKKHTISIVLTFIVVFSVIGFMWSFNGMSTVDEILNPLPYGMMIFILMGICIFMSYSPDENFMRQIADKLGYIYFPYKREAIQSMALTEKYLSPSLIGASGYSDDLPNLLYYYVISSAAAAFGRGVSYEYTVMETVYPKSLPTLLLISTQKPTRLQREIKPSSIPDSIVIDLGGEFSEYFTLYASKGSEAEVRKIFTPEIAKEIITDESFRSFHMEISGQRIFLFRYLRILEGQRLLDFYHNALRLNQIIGSKLTNTPS